MTEFIRISFVIVLFYLVFLIIPIFKAGLDYDLEKKKISDNYNGDHTGFKSQLGHFRIPWLIRDSNPQLEIYVAKYNKLTKIFWSSYLIGLPLLIFLGNHLNKL